MVFENRRRKEHVVLGHYLQSAQTLNVHVLLLSSKREKSVRNCSQCYSQLPSGGH